MREHTEETTQGIADLRNEIAHLRQAVVSHAVIDQAIGVVIALSGVRPETAWDALKEVSQNTNIKLREVADHVVRWPHCGCLPREIRAALEGALRRRKRTPTAPAPAQAQVQVV